MFDSGLRLAFVLAAVKLLGACFPSTGRVGDEPGTNPSDEMKGGAEEPGANTGGGGASSSPAEAQAGSGGIFSVHLDAATSDAGTAVTGADARAAQDVQAMPPAHSRPAFVAVGPYARTTISCDEGHTWIANRSDNDRARCQNPDDCTHGSITSTGLAAGHDSFVALFGHGTASTARRSQDGVTWSAPLPLGNEQTGLAFAGSAYLVFSPMTPLSSIDSGVSFTKLPNPGLGFTNGRATAYVNNVFLGLSDNGMALSTDLGKTWKINKSAGACTSGVGNKGIAGGGGTIVLVKENGSYCRSTDGGATFTSGQIGTGPLSQVIWTGNEFMVWGGGRRFSSQDGLTWQTAALVPANVKITAVARSNKGTFVSVQQSWNAWYEKQTFLRSDDGLNWQRLPAGAFNGSHPIEYIVYGNVATSVMGCKP